ncbi:MAG: cytochrome c3 family protein [bacterium]
MSRKKKDQNLTEYPGFSVYVKWFKEHIPVLIGVLAIGGGLHGYVGVKLAGQPLFCKVMCHEMSIHYDTYVQTKHGKAEQGPVCMDCHAVPGFFNHLLEHVVAIRFMIPHVTTPYLADEGHIHKNVKGFDEEEMDFNDKTPLEEEEIFKKCHVCHPNRAAKSYFMHPEDHGRTVLNNNCRRCHARIVKVAEKDFVKAKKLLYAKSWTSDEPHMLANVHPLHLGLDFTKILKQYPRLKPYVERDNPAWKNRIRCTACHSRIIHSTHPEKKHVPGMRRCQRCHDNKLAPRDECPICHIGPKNTFLGVKAIGMEEMESPMVDNECTDCHNLSKNYKVYLEACDDCHEDSPERFKKFRKKWLDSYEVTTKNFKDVERYIGRLKRAGKNMLPYMKLYKRAKYNYLYAARDYSKGIHNAPFTDALFKDANQNFLTLLELFTASRAR